MKQGRNTDKNRREGEELKRKKISKPDPRKKQKTKSDKKPDFQKKSYNFV